MPPRDLMSEEQRAWIREIAEEAATAALRRVGLHDDSARDDVHELRTLLDYWRDAKRGLVRRIMAWIGTSALAIGAALMGLHWGSRP